MGQIDVLVIEDCKYWADINIRQLMKAGFHVNYQLVASRKAMMMALAEKTWHLIISDNSMPNFDALQALEIRNKICGQVPFVIVSEDITSEEIERALNSGCDAYVPKVEYAKLRRVSLELLPTCI